MNTQEKLRLLGLSGDVVKLGNIEIGIIYNEKEEYEEVGEVLYVGNGVDPIKVLINGRIEELESEQYVVLKTSIEDKLFILPFESKRDYSLKLDYRCSLEYYIDSGGEKKTPEMLLKERGVYRRLGEAYTYSYCYWKAGSKSECLVHASMESREEVYGRYMLNTGDSLVLKYSDDKVWVIRDNVEIELEKHISDIFGVRSLYSLRVELTALDDIHSVVEVEASKYGRYYGYVWVCRDELIGLIGDHEKKIYVGEEDIDGSICVVVMETIRYKDKKFEYKIRSVFLRDRNRFITKAKDLKLLDDILEIDFENGVSGEIDLIKMFGEEFECTDVVNNGFKIKVVEY